MLNDLSRVFTKYSRYSHNLDEKVLCDEIHSSIHLEQDYGDTLPEVSFIEKSTTRDKCVCTYGRY